MRIKHHTFFLIIYCIYDHHHQIGTRKDNIPFKTQVCSPGAYNLSGKLKQVHTATYGNIKQLMENDKWLLQGQLLVNCLCRDPLCLQVALMGTSLWDDWPSLPCHPLQEYRKHSHIFGSHTLGVGAICNAATSSWWPIWVARWPQSCVLGLWLLGKGLLGPSFSWGHGSSIIRSSEK